MNGFWCKAVSFELKSYFEFDLITHLRSDLITLPLHPKIHSRQTIAMMGFWCQAVWSGLWAMGCSDGDQRSYLTSQWQGCKIFAMIVHTPSATPTSTPTSTSTTATATVYLSIVNWAAELSAVLLFPSSTLHLNLLCPFWLWPPPPKETGQCRDLDKVCDHISVFNWLKLTETRVWMAAETFIQKDKLAFALGSSVTIPKSYVLKLHQDMYILSFFVKIWKAAPISVLHFRIENWHAGVCNKNHNVQYCTLLYRAIPYSGLSFHIYFWHFLTDLVMDGVTF